MPEGRDAILEEPIAVRGNGTIAIPQEQGLGLSIDKKKLRRFGHRFYRMNTVKLAVHTIRKMGQTTPERRRQFYALHTPSPRESRGLVL